MVLDRLGSDEPALAQGTLVEFRERLIRSNMDLRLLERTVELARRTNAFDWRKLPEDSAGSRVDSSPLVGAGRVEDTINLLARRRPQSGGLRGGPSGLDSRPCGAGGGDSAAAREQRQAGPR